METVTSQVPGVRKSLIILAWLMVLIISDIPDVIINYASERVPPWILAGKIIVLVLFNMICLFSRKIRPLLPYSYVMLVFFLALLLSERIRTSAWWIGLIDSEVKPSFFLTYLRPFIRDIGVVIIVILSMWFLKGNRKDFFLARGDLKAPVEPERWLGIGSGANWIKVGLIFAIAAALIVAIPTIIGLKPSADVIKKCIPLIPVVLLFAAINSFNEEIYFRATILSTLTEVIGKTHTLLINAVMFGMAHYLYGSPPGVIGLAMTGFLAYFLGKSMLETKGLFWPWFIHFLPDVMIFFSYAIAFSSQV